MRSEEISIPSDNSYFYELQDLMFAPSKKQCSKEEYWTKVGEAIDKLKGHCLKFLNSRPKGAATIRSSKIPPWIYRANNEYIIANLNPLLSRAIFVMKNCAIGDIDVLPAVIDYYSRTMKIVTPHTMYRLSDEMCGKKSKMNHSYNDEIFFFSKPRGIICPQTTSVNRNDDFSLALDKRKGVDPEYDGDDSNIYIRMSFYSTKEDLLWFVEKYWDEMSEQINFGGRNNWDILEDTEEELRRRMTKCLIACNIYLPKELKIGPTAITEFIDRHFENEKSVTPKSIDTQRRNLENDFAADPFDKVFHRLLKSDDALTLSCDIDSLRSRNNYKRFLSVDSESPLTIACSDKMSDEYKELLDLADNL